jgi:hypothetical protein
MNENDLVVVARILANNDSDWNWYTLDLALA